MVLGALGLNALLILLIPVGFIALVVSLIKRIANNHHYIYFEQRKLRPSFIQSQLLSVSFKCSTVLNPSR